MGSVTDHGASEREGEVEKEKTVPVVQTVQAVQIVDGRRFGTGKLAAKPRQAREDTDSVGARLIAPELDSGESNHNAKGDIRELRN